APGTSTPPRNGLARPSSILGIAHPAGCASRPTRAHAYTQVSYMTLTWEALMPARPVSRTVPALTLLCLSLLVAVARPAQAQPLADRVPADALVYVGWQGAAHLGAGFD